MSEDAVFRQLQVILELLDSCHAKMDEIGRPKLRNIMWRSFFPAGEFMTQKSTAKSCAVLMLDVDSRIRDMIEVLEEHDHPLVSQIVELRYLNLAEMAEKLMELPERVQYMGGQIDEFRERVKAIIKQVKRDSDPS